MSEVNFTNEMYEAARGGAESSARVIVPLALRVANAALARMERGGSVVAAADVGCGEGCFARELARQGVSVTAYDATAIEGKIEDGVTFRYIDLHHGGWVERADLALCLEVAEHLPEEAAAPLIEGLCASAPLVLFSAAIPGQGGWGHVNCQWPRYWVELFERYDYGVTGAMRFLLWGDHNVESWYQQNLLFASSNPAQLRAALDDVAQRLLHEPIPLVHPDVWLAWVLPDAERP